jgi:hypothetical protein
MILEEKTMNHQVIISDEAYQAIAALAATQGKTPEELIESWAIVVRQSIVRTEERHQTFEEFFSDLGMSGADIQHAKDNADF